MTPPALQRDKTTKQIWGHELIDHYKFLEQKDSADVIRHLEDENRYTENFFSPLKELEETLYKEIRARIKETDMSVPVKKDDWLYYSLTEEGLDYEIHCRRPALGDETDASGSAHQPQQQILLDENLEAQKFEGDHFDTGCFDISPDHQQVIWSVDTKGNDRHQLFVRRLDIGHADTTQDVEVLDIDDGLIDVSANTAWANDSKSFLYLRIDDANRPHEVWHHVVGTASSEDKRLYVEEDERFFLGVGREKDGSFIQISCSSKMTDEIMVVPADDLSQPVRVLRPRSQGVEYSVAHHGDRFVILTNLGATGESLSNFRIVTTPDNAPEEQNWQELIGETANVTLTDIDVSEKFLTIFLRKDSTTRIQLRYWESGDITEIAQPEQVSTIWAGSNPEYFSTSIRYGYTSMVTPPSVFSYDTESKERTLLKQQEVLGNYDPSQYASARLWATAPDQTRVPISLVWKRDGTETKQDHGEVYANPKPLLLNAYGAYEISLDPYFSSIRLSLLDRGFCFAIAHPRGGGEMGRQWYEDGRLENKQNTFSDVIAVAQHLIGSGATTAEQLVLRGGSAGGLMAGAVVNQAPELFAAIVAEVPFVDVVATMLDADLPLTVTEWEEWGNPAEDEAQFKTIRAYSPINNVKRQAYPSVLATAGLNDPWVSYWEPAKWVQELRHHNQATTEILLLTDLKSGHSGPSSRYQVWQEEAKILSYILWAAGLENRVPA